MKYYGAKDLIAKIKTACFVPSLVLLIPFLLAASLANPAFGRGTPAGTVISNQAELQYSQQGVFGAVARSNTVQFTVYKVIDVAVQSLDAGGVPTGSPDAAVPLSFKVTNLGNAAEVFRLERVALSVVGDFTPTVSSTGSIFIENGLQAGFQASGPYADAQYVSGSNDLNLAADASYTVYLSSDFAANLANGRQGRAAIRAVAVTTGAAGSVPGTSVPSASSVGGFAVVGASRAVAEATGSYVVTGLRLIMTKTQVAVRAPNGSSDLISGAECDYLVDIQLQGSTGNIDDVIVEDPLPATLRYLANSLKINGVAKTDLADADEAQVVNEKISIKLGRLVPSNRFSITYTTRLQ
jgi:trimeric autotransporter adhesin